MFNRENFKGFTLIEYCIAMMLSLLLIGSLVSIYLTASNNHRTLIQLNKFQENIRDISQILTSDIHLAGFMGCAKMTEDFPFNNPFNFDLSSKIKIDTTGDSDGITLFHAESNTATLLADMMSDSTFAVSKAVEFLPGDMILLADCKQAELFKIKTVKSFKFHQFITADHPLKFFFNKKAELSRLAINHYFIKNHQLKVKDIYQHESSLVEGVNNMKIITTDTAISFKLILASADDALKKVIYVVAAERN